MHNAIASRRAALAAVIWLPVLATITLPAPAQELSLSSGADQSGTHSSYEWQLEFREPLTPNASASLGWINDGHLQHQQPGCEQLVDVRAGLPVLVPTLVCRRGEQF